MKRLFEFLEFRALGGRITEALASLGGSVDLGPGEERQEIVAEVTILESPADAAALIAVAEHLDLSAAWTGEPGRSFLTGIAVVSVTSGTSRFYQPDSAITSSVVVTHGEQIDNNGHFRRTPRKKGLTFAKVLFPIGALLFVSFWAWALFFASKTSVNKIEDRAWAARAEIICSPVKEELRGFEMQADPSLDVRADLVVQSTDTLGRMLDDLVAVTPTDAKGQAIVPAWIADWRQPVSYTHLTLPTIYSV